MSDITGGCLCGAVRYSAKEHHGGGHCFCEDCRRSSGSSHCSHMIVRGDQFDVQGEVRFFVKPADSGNQISRGFCPNCGSAVYSRNSAMPGMLFVRASSLDDADRFEPGMIVYRSRAPKWSAMDPDLPAFDEMPPPEAMAAAMP